MRRALHILTLSAACLGAAGCRHQTKPPSVPPLPPVTKEPLVPAPEPATVPQVASEPIQPAPLPTKSVQPKVKKLKKKMEPPPSAAPVEVASAAPPSPPTASVVGSLTDGGNAVAERQKAAEAIATVEKRLAGLSASTLDAQKDGIGKVRIFLRQAHDALKSGDADGASVLATKAGVLLEDLLK